MVLKYKFKVNDGKLEVDEIIEIDIEKEIEKFYILDNGNISDLVFGEVDVVYDFKLVSEWVGLGRVV